MKKKITALFLALALTLGLSVPVAAETPPEETGVPVYLENNQLVGDTITNQQSRMNGVRWAAISYITHGISINSSGVSTSSATCRLYYADYKATLTTTIQKWDGTKYVDKYGPWSDTDKGGAFVSKNYAVERGTYRLKTICKVYNANGVLVEQTDPVYSNSATY